MGEDFARRWRSPLCQCASLVCHNRRNCTQSYTMGIGLSWVPNRQFRWRGHQYSLENEIVWYLVPWSTRNHQGAARETGFCWGDRFRAEASEGWWDKRPALSGLHVRWMGLGSGGEWHLSILFKFIILKTLQDILAHDVENHGATFCPVILGSDKTTMSVATGQNKYYPLYISNGLIHNNVRWAHVNGVSLLAFLAIPKSTYSNLFCLTKSQCEAADREHKDSLEFWQFWSELFHSSLTRILQSLCPGMSRPKIIRYSDGYYRRTIFGLGPYIADYPEQALLACIVQGWCPKCTANKDNLDGVRGWRMHQLTQTLMEAFDEKILWDDYGSKSGIMVSFNMRLPR